MNFDILSEITDIETITKGSGIRDLHRLRKTYGAGDWRKMKGIARIRLSTEESVWPSSIGMKRTGLARRRLSVNVIWSKSWKRHKKLP